MAGVWLVVRRAKGRAERPAEVRADRWGDGARLRCSEMAAVWVKVGCYAGSVVEPAEMSAVGEIVMWVDTVWRMARGEGAGEALQTADCKLQKAKCGEEGAARSSSRVR